MISYSGLLLLVFGWFATHAFTEMRERRKELRHSLDKLCEKIWKLEEQAQAFHSSSDYQLALNREILTAIFHIQRELKRLQITEGPEIVEAMWRWRSSISLDNFDSSTFSPQLPESIILSGIVNATANMEDIIESSYLAKYPPAFPYFRLPLLFRHAIDQLSMTIAAQLDRISK